MAETQFLTELVNRTGCGLLLDINNVYVSAQNLGFDAEAYVKSMPAAAVGEIHLAGFAENQTPDGSVLIDAHGSRVAPQVWSLYRTAIARIGKRPTLIEWDSDLPPLSTLLGEAMWADLLADSVSFREKRKPSSTRPNLALVERLMDVTPKSVPVAVCDHHPLAAVRLGMEGAHA
jgi:hypothetical protein